VVLCWRDAGAGFMECYIVNRCLGFRLAILKGVVLTLRPMLSKTYLFVLYRYIKGGNPTLIRKSQCLPQFSCMFQQGAESR
jgi:hypothetical protein